MSDQPADSDPTTWVPVPPPEGFVPPSADEWAKLRQLARSVLPPLGKKGRERRERVRVPNKFALPLPDGERVRLQTLAVYALPAFHPDSAHRKSPATPLSPYSRRSLVRMVRTFPNWRQVFRAEFKRLTRRKGRLSGDELKETLRFILADVKRSIAMYLHPQPSRPQYEHAAENGELQPSVRMADHFHPRPPGER